MIELLFSDTGAAGLALAKGQDASTLFGGFLTTDKDGNESFTPCPPDAYNGPFIEGKAEDIAAFWFMGDVGEIAHLDNWDARLKIIREITALQGWEEDNWIEQETGRIHQLINRLKHAVTTGEDIRIWWSSSSAETCGMYWAMSLLQNATGNVTNIKVPDLYCANHTLTATDTGDLEPREFYDLLQYEQPLPKETRQKMARIWEKLVQENAKLRVVINGIPCSVTVDFYDDIIDQIVPQNKEIVIGEIIGKCLPHAPSHQHDAWYAYRIQHWIQAGKLELVLEKPQFYSCSVRRI